MADFPSWQQGVRTDYPPLRRPAQADVAIVGGGLSGITLACCLQQCGVQTLLLEADTLGHGATFGCGGAVTCQAGESFQRIRASAGLNAARTYAQLLREAVHLSAQMASNLPACRLTERTLYLYAETEDDLPALKHLLALENELGLPLSIASDAGGCPFPVELSALLRHQYTLAPLPYLLGMAEHAARNGCRIHEHTPVLALDGTTLHTKSAAVQADFVVLCTGVPAALQDSQVLSLLEPRLRETRVLAETLPLHTLQYAVHGDEPRLIPCADKLLTVWDRGAYGTQESAVSRLIRDRTLRALLPEAQTRDVILRREIFSRDGLPLIGAIDPRNSQVMMIGGFSGAGIPGATMAARLLSESILGHPSPEISLFRPFRQHSRLIAVRHALRRKLHRWRHLTAPRCPHMGCPLHYHPDSRTWQCPCHGSSFDVFGRVLSAPAVQPAALSPRDRP